MTKEQINRAIAESLGWSGIEDRSAGLMMMKGFSVCGYPSTGAVIGQKQPFPNYHSSLDACVEFERTMTSHATQDEYVSLLAADLYQNCDGIPTRQDEAWVCCVSTPSQRCEAYLRTIGKWVESEIPLRSQPSAPIFPPLS
jgi:hypothetical protein